MDPFLRIWIELRKHWGRWRFVLFDKSWNKEQKEISISFWDLRKLVTKCGNEDHLHVVSVCYQNFSIFVPLNLLSFNDPGVFLLMPTQWRRRLFANIFKTSFEGYCEMIVQKCWFNQTFKSHSGNISSKIFSLRRENWFSSKKDVAQNLHLKFISRIWHKFHQKVERIEFQFENFVGNLNQSLSFGLSEILQFRN